MAIVETKKQGRGNKIDDAQRCPYCKSNRVTSNSIRYKKKNGILDKKNPIGRKYVCHDCGKYFTQSFTTTDIRVIVIADTHCGHRTGLTPTGWQQKGDDIYSQFQQESWTWFENMIEMHKPFDILICNGDMIDGRQEKSGSKELIAVDRNTQARMAAEVIERVGATKIYMTRGTPYHTGKLEDWEDSIAERVGAEISNILRLSVNGCIFDVKHKTGRSTVPQGRFTAMAKTAMWNDLMNASNGKKANVIIRSHVHYHIFGGHSNNRLFFTTCALQGATDFGDKECEGSVNYGFSIIDIGKQGEITNFKTFEPEFKTDFREIIEFEV